MGGWDFSNLTPKFALFLPRVGSATAFVQRTIAVGGAEKPGASNAVGGVGLLCLGLPHPLRTDVYGQDGHGHMNGQGANSRASTVCGSV